jgi:hypothetical protein
LRCPQFLLNCVECCAAVKNHPPTGAFRPAGDASGRGTFPCICLVTHGLPSSHPGVINNSRWPLPASEQYCTPVCSSPAFSYSVADIFIFRFCEPWNSSIVAVNKGRQPPLSGIFLRNNHLSGFSQLHINWRTALIGATAPYKSSVEPVSDSIESDRCIQKS